MDIDYQLSEQNQHNYAVATEALAQGHFNKASRILRQALVDCQIIGSINPQLIRSVDILAEQYFHDGDYANAASLYRAILEVRIKLLGLEHPDVRESRRKLMQALWQTGGLSPNLMTT